MRVLRGPDREAAEPDRGRDRLGELRHRARGRGIPPGGVAHPADRRRRSRRLWRQPPRPDVPPAVVPGRFRRLYRFRAAVPPSSLRRPRRRRHLRYPLTAALFGCLRRPRHAVHPCQVVARRCQPSAPAHRLRRPGAPGPAPGDGPRVPIPWLAVAFPRPRHARRRLGRLAPAPCRLAQPQARRRDDGHPRLTRHDRRLRLVLLRPGLRQRRRAGHADELLPDRVRRWQTGHLPRGRQRRHRFHPARPLP